jgi:hypothetical protein
MRLRRGHNPSRGGYELRFGARSAAGRMTPLSLTPNVREPRFHGATSTCGLRFPLSMSGLSCFLLPTSLCSRQREVGAAPHRGNANRPITIQGKANTVGTRTSSASQTNKTRKDQPHKHPNNNRRAGTKKIHPLPHSQIPQNRNPLHPVQPDMLPDKPRRDPRSRDHDQITVPAIPKIQ